MIQNCWKIAFALTLLGCNAMKDVSLYEPVSSPITHPLDNFAYKEIFTDSKNSGVWGMKTHPCKEVYFDSINSFIGENHLHIIWNDKQKCKYIGFGFKWGNFKGKNLAPLIDQCAIEFMARLDSGELTKVPMFFSLVDYAGKNCFSKINILDIEGGKIDTSWTKILIPLSTFKYQNKGVNISNIKELRIELQKSGNIHIDNMKIVPHVHDYNFQQSLFSKTFNTFPISIGNEKKYWWGINEKYSDNFKFTTASTFNSFDSNSKSDSTTILPEFEVSLSLSINYTKDAQDYKWNNFGFPINKWEYADFSKIYSTSAISFKIKADIPPPIQVTLVSFSGKTRRLYKIPDNNNYKINAAGFYEYYVPIKSFTNYAKFNWASFKEIRFKILDSCVFEIGDFSIVEFRGNPKKPIRWAGI